MDLHQSKDGVGVISGVGVGVAVGKKAKLSVGVLARVGKSTGAEVTGMVASAVGVLAGENEQAVIAPIKLKISSALVMLLVNVRVMQDYSLLIFT